MKTIAIFTLLAVSLLANGLMLQRRYSGPAARTDGVMPRPAPMTPDTSRSSTSAEVPAPDGPSADLPVLVAELQAAGLPAELVRAWISAEIDERNAARERASLPPPKSKYWLPDPVVPFANRLALAELRIEKSRLLDQLLGFDPRLPENAPYAFLPPDKQAKAKAIAEEYVARLAIYRSATAAMPTPREEAEVARLEAAQAQELGALLTEAEQAQLGFRLTLAQWKPPAPDVAGVVAPDPNMPRVERLRVELRNLDLTEEEFIAIAAIDREFEPIRRFGRLDSAQLEQRFRDLVRERLGEERFADYLRKSDPEYAGVADLVLRLGLPISQALDVTELKERVFAESARVYNDASMSGEEKGSALGAFAARERARLLAILGNDGLSAITRYTNRWIRPLEQGNALIQGPGAISIRPVIPSAARGGRGATPAAGGR